MDNLHNVNFSGGYYSQGLFAGLDSKNPKKIGGIFEGMFFRTLLKQMRESTFGEDILGGREMDAFNEMYDEELANNLGSRGYLGIAKNVADLIASKSS